jgi:hypothetical protein
MYKCEVRPRSGRESAVQAASKQQGGAVDRRYLPSAICFELLSFSTGRLSRYGALAVLTGSVISVLSGCGVTTNSSSSQKGSGDTPTASLTMISCGVQSLTGAQTKTCSVYLSSSATQPANVLLTSSNAALKVPASVTVQTGAKTADFNATIEAVAKSVSVTITGTADGVAETDVITLNPVSEPNPTPVPTLEGVSCGKQSLTGPATMTCSVSLSAAATSQTAVTLSSGNSALKVPATVDVASGKTSATFNATASAVSSTQKVSLTARADGVSRSETIILYPASPISEPVASLSKVSCAAQTLTGPTTESCTVYLSSAATSQTTVLLSSNNSALRAPSSVTVAEGSTTAGFSVTASAVSATQKATLTATAGGEKQTDVITLSPTSVIPEPVATLSKVSCGAQTLTGPTTESCTVYLSSAATSQMTVLLSSSNSALRPPASVTVAEGSTTAGFSVTASAVSTSQRATLTATAGGEKQTDVITLSPASPTSEPAAKLAGLSCGTQSLTGAQIKTCSVSLSAAATSPLVVTLSSSSTALKAPASVTVAAGATSATFSVTASAVSASQKATLTATSDGVSQTDVITLYPAQAATPALSKISCATQTLIILTTESCTVSLSATATSATVVALSSSKSVLKVPASVTVAVGSTSVSFAATALSVLTTQLVTLTATANGVSQTDVIQVQAATSSQPATSHEVQLTWDAPSSTSDPIAGYHVYRTTGSTSNYEVVSALVAQTSYTDTTVQSGTTYDYIVKSVDADGVESVGSNTVSVTIP